MGHRLIDLTVPKVMGILNVTPDSFYDGGRHASEHAVLTHVEQMATAGATFIDVGGYSTRPRAAEVNEIDEIHRVTTAISAIKKEFPDLIISIDTFRSKVARRAMDAGASMINDITAGEYDPDMFSVVAQSNVPYIIMHMRGTPETMSTLTSYENLIKEITDYFHPKIKRLEQAGVTDIITDPGFGFAKTIEQNFELLNGLHYFQILTKPILVGLSRKSMIWKTLAKNPETALNGTTALNAIALTKGASIIRVHDVAEAIECVKLVSLLQQVNY